jgi:peptidoglycan/LPS O-acetylase OafA/YrhL
MAGARQDMTAWTPSPPQPPFAVAFLRCATLVLLILAQSFELTPGFGDFLGSPLWVVRPAGWAMLFALAGHTLGDSAGRRDTRAFLLRRAVRTWPQLAISVVICALAIGPLFSRIGLRLYFLAPEFRGWFLNFLALPRFTLPGLFDFNSQPHTVNGVYWAVPVYVALVATAAVHDNGRRWRRMVPAMVPLAALVLAHLLPGAVLGFFADSGLSPAEATGFPLLALLAGTAGMAAGRWRLRRPQRRIIGLIALAGIAAVGALGQRDWAGEAAFCLGMAAGAVALVHALRARGIIRTLDQQARRWVPVAYLTFLLAYPAQQIAATHGPDGDGPLGNFLLAVPITGILCLTMALGLRLGLRRLGLGQVLGEVAHPLDEMVPPRFTRRWWMARARQLVAIAGIVVLVAVLVVGILVVVLTAFQPDPGGA